MQLLPREQTSTVTQKGQVTIPVYMREALGIKTGTRVYFEADKNGFLKIRPSKFSLESVYGSIKPLKENLSLKEVRKIALEDKLNAIR